MKAALIIVGIIVIIVAIYLWATRLQRWRKNLQPGDTVWYQQHGVWYRGTVDRVYENVGDNDSVDVGPTMRRKSQLFPKEG